MCEDVLNKGVPIPLPDRFSISLENIINCLKSIEEQESKLNMYIGTSRFIYNYLLKKELYDKSGYYKVVEKGWYI